MDWAGGGIRVEYRPEWRSVHHAIVHGGRLHISSSIDGHSLVHHDSVVGPRGHVSRSRIGFNSLIPDRSSDNEIPVVRTGARFPWRRR